jgi:uncharacterized protein YukJ
MLASLIDIAKTDKIQSSDVSDLINSMLSSAGLKHKTSLSYEDFKVILASNLQIQSSDMSDLINSMLSTAGLKHKTSLSYEDFKVPVIFSL